MKLLVRSATRAIHDASNLGAWQALEGFVIVDVTGDAETFAWPNGHPTRCLLDAGGAVVANPDWNAAAEAAAEAARQLSAVKLFRALSEAARKALNQLRQNPTTVFPAVDQASWEEFIKNEYTALV